MNSNDTRSGALYGIEHPDDGLMLNKSSSAEYLGVSLKKFERIATPPDYIEDGVYPYWSKRVLDLLPTTDDFDHDEVWRKGVACGSYLLKDKEDEEIRRLRNEVGGALGGGKFRTHKCGADKLSPEMDLLEKANWQWANCNCKSSSPAEEATFVLASYGIPIRFCSNRHAKTFCEGILCAIKRYVKQRIATMTRAEAEPYVNSWGGSYQGLLATSRFIRGD